MSAVGSGGPGSWYEALATSAPVQGAEEVLLGVHTATGLPWWACIGLTTVALRGAVTLPLAAYQHYILAKLGGKFAARNKKHCKASQPRNCNSCKSVEMVQKSCKRLTYLKNMRRLVSELYVRDNCHPFKATVLVWIQFPMWIFMSIALRNFSTGATHSEGFSVQEQLANDGILWFRDLTALDSTWILPISVGVINLLIVENFCSAKNWNVSFSDVYYVLRSCSISVDDSSCCDSTFTSIVLYWLCSSFMGLSQNLLLRSPRFRRLCRIPLTKSDSDTPYKDLFAAFYAKFISRT
ncbi:cytochrome c oxidase assembly protein COX18 [Prionailurus iriomotensis]